MIARLRGTVWSVGDSHLILHVGGVGFHVNVPAGVLDQAGGAGEFIDLFTYLHVREADLALYGFISEEQLSLFKLLLGVSGVGPKVALSVLSMVSPDVLRQAVVQEEPALLSRVPGIGPKTARAIIFHLKDKVAGVTMAGASFSDSDAEVIGALTSLGFSVIEAQRALQSLPRDADVPIEERVRLALTFFDRR